MLINEAAGGSPHTWGTFNIRAMWIEAMHFCGGIQQ